MDAAALTATCSSSRSVVRTSPALFAVKSKVCGDCMEGGRGVCVRALPLRQCKAVSVTIFGVIRAETPSKTEFDFPELPAETLERIVQYMHFKVWSGVTVACSLCSHTASFERDFIAARCGCPRSPAPTARLSMIAPGHRQRLLLNRPWPWTF